jgi:hypothetical protein
MLEFRLAGIGSRFVALAIDTLIQGVGVLVVLAELLHWFDWMSRRASIWAAVLLWLGVFLIESGYFAFVRSDLERADVRQAS